MNKKKKKENRKERKKRNGKRRKNKDGKEKKKGNELPSPRIEMSRFPRHRGKLFLSSIAAKEQG